jgi:hypothetical protein
MNVPNHQHNSGKDLKGRGTCKGKQRARKQARKALLLKLKAKA